MLRTAVLAGLVDGSLASLTAVDEGAFKRLHLLQGQLVRTVQHVAALNPKAFRCAPPHPVLPTACRV